MFMTGFIVSIIIPNYNSEKFIGETIDSVLNQSYSNWELIIIDDNSTDRSKEIIYSSYVSNNTKIRLYENRVSVGANICRNIGLEKAIGDYIIFLDSDDCLASFCLEQRVSFLKKNFSLDFCVFNSANFIYEIDDGAMFTILDINNPIDHFLGYDCIWQTMSPIWKKTFLIKIGGFNEKYPRLQDVELVTRALLTTGVNYQLVPESLPDSFYRIEKKRNSIKGRKLYLALLLYIEDYYEVYKKSNERVIKSILVTLFFFHYMYCEKEDIIMFKEKVNQIMDKKIYFFIIRLLSNWNIIVFFRISFFRSLFGKVYASLRNGIWK